MLAGAAEALFADVAASVITALFFVCRAAASRWCVVGQSVACSGSLAQARCVSVVRRHHVLG